MARMGGQDRGITQRKGREGWWARVYINGRQRWFKCDTKSQAKALYGRLKADAREGKYFPEKFATPKDITLRAWTSRYLEGSSNRGIFNERRYGRRWSLLLGNRLISQITTEDLRRIQARMKARGQWSDGTINRHFAFLRHVLMLAVKDGKLAGNPVSGIKFLPEVRRTRFLIDVELTRLENVMTVPYWKPVAFAIETGLRREEQFRLRWDQVDLESGIVTIPSPQGRKNSACALERRRTGHPEITRLLHAVSVGISEPEESSPLLEPTELREPCLFTRLGEGRDSRGLLAHAQAYRSQSTSYGRGGFSLCERNSRAP